MDGRISLEEGTRVALEVQNGSAENLYMGLVNIDMSGAVLLAPPLAGAAEAVSAGRTLRIGAARGIELKIPAGYPPDPADRQEGGGETLLLLASTMPTDFQVLVQQRDAVPPGKLAALFRAAFHLQPERAATFLPKGPAAVERWAVARVHYRLRPRPSL